MANQLPNTAFRYCVLFVHNSLQAAPTIEDKMVYHIWGYLLGIAIGCILWYFAGRFLRFIMIPALVGWCCVVLGGFVGVYSMRHSTTPSFAVRVTATGKARGCTISHPSKGEYLYEFLLQRNDGVELPLRVRFQGPMCAAAASGADDRVYRVAYLDDRNRTPSDEVVSIEVLSGAGTGWRKELDARPFGLWLGIPAGVAIMMLGLLRLRFPKMSQLARRSRRQFRKWESQQWGTDKSE